MAISQDGHWTEPLVVSDRLNEVVRGIGAKPGPGGASRPDRKALRTATANSPSGQMPSPVFPFPATRRCYPPRPFTDITHARAWSAGRRTGDDLFMLAPLMERGGGA